LRFRPATADALSPPAFFVVDFLVFFGEGVMGTFSLLVWSVVADIERITFVGEADWIAINRFDRRPTDRTAASPTADGSTISLSAILPSLFRFGIPKPVTVVGNMQRTNAIKK
jgi:hypothetical protein